MKENEIRDLKVQLIDKTNTNDMITSSLVLKENLINKLSSTLTFLNKERNTYKQEYNNDDEKLILLKERNDKVAELIGITITTTITININIIVFTTIFILIIIYTNNHKEIRPIVDLIKKLENDLSLSAVPPNFNISNEISNDNRLWTSLPLLITVLPNLYSHIQNLLEQVNILV